MNTQPEALRLAGELCAAPERSRTSFEAAAELRRLHAELEATDRQVDILTDELSKCDKMNQELLDVLKQMESALSRCFGPHKVEEGDRHRALAAARAAIAKSEEEQA